MMNYEWYDIIGNIGVLTILSCYLLLQLGRLHADGLAFSVLNAIGASLILVSLVYEFNISAFLIEFFWLLISIYGIVNFSIASAKRRVPS